MYKQHHEIHTELAEVALGKRKAEVVIEKGTLVNVLTSELLENQSIAISNGRVAYVGDDVTHTIGPDTRIIQAEGRYIAPGLMDAHMHVESTMLSVTEFAKAAMAKGTTSIFMDPHEIANVFGAEGVRLMHEEGQQLPLKVFTTFPSCVPATDHLEDAGAKLDVADIKEGLTWDNVVGLGEVMNFPGVIQGDAKMIGEIKETMKANKTVTGHFPDGSDEMLQAYIASGVTSDHETVTREEGLKKARLGMHVMIREGSAWHDVKEVIKIVTEDKVSTENIMLVTDDVYPQTLVEQGHLNHVVRRAIEEGVAPVTAIQMATINVARYYRKDHDLGSIAPGKCADIMLLDDLHTVEPTLVMTDGQVIVENKQIVGAFPAYLYPAHIKNSVQVGRKFKPEDFLLKSKRDNSSTRINVIKVIENSARTEKLEADVPVVDGIIQPDVEQDILRIACIDRHHGSGQLSLGFTQGFQIKKGAVASTVAHDSHNLLVMGENVGDMVVAANLLAESGGGMIVVQDAEVLAHVRMPIAGLMSDQTLETVIREVTELEQAWKQIGSLIHAPFMTFSLIALPVIPEIRITNRGIADITNFELIETEIEPN
ncbi:adenine deaminase [Oceanobacillus alkalisoli]|uniref:adenine deaminase n=1 Tax=Oceanobacillus alkalisoli TaxID=2925113 RepID=UPI001EEF9C71|nr:adenine deaminase [Oceanobacillus alkalisoli]MCF3944805.1 adenine deaminase [Oceanobacillus alkalisoli]MCG5105317.1 adenine deaminase [Oceanobacillus alkalisoli]